MTMCRLPFLAAVCCGLLLLTTFPGSTESASCCLSYSKQVLRCKQLNSYSLQTIHGSCDLPAIIFYGQKNVVCADPYSSRTIRVMQCVNSQKRKNWSTRRHA